MAMEAISIFHIDVCLRAFASADLKHLGELKLKVSKAPRWIHLDRVQLLQMLFRRSDWRACLAFAVKMNQQWFPSRLSCLLCIILPLGVCVASLLSDGFVCSWVLDLSTSIYCGKSISMFLVCFIVHCSCHIGIN